jgi:hypothetical protein
MNSNKSNNKVKAQWRELDPVTGQFKTHSKVQAGATLERFNTNSLLAQDSFINKVLAVLHEARDKWQGSAGIRKAYNEKYGETAPSNSFRPIMSSLYSLGFVDRFVEGKHMSLYKLKPDIDINDRQDLHKRAIEAKKQETRSSL